MIELAPNHKRGLSLSGPVINASGILGFAGEYRGLVDFDRLSAFVTNALTATRRTPAAPPNAVPLPNGVLIHTGLPNPGVRAAVRRYAREWTRLGPPVIVHLAATSLAEVQRSLDILERAESVSGLELGLRDDVSMGEATRLIRAAIGGLPLIVRLPILRAVELCAAAAQAGADALTVGGPPRTTTSPPARLRTGTAWGGSTPPQPAPGPLPIAKTSPPAPLSNSIEKADGAGEGESLDEDEERIVGRLYSPENFPIVLEAVRQVSAKNLGLPVIGAGGIFSVEDVREMLAAGALAVQLDAVLWNDPGILLRL